jgi:hypothetical protein
MGHTHYYAAANHETASKFVGQERFAAKYLAGERVERPSTSPGRSGSMGRHVACCERKPMKKLVIAILLVASPALAQTKLVPPKGVTARVDNCAPIGRTEDGRLVYSMKCDTLPAPVAPPPQAEAAPAPPPEPEIHRSGIFGLSYEAKRPDQ